MNYFLFNNEILVADGAHARRVDKNDIPEILNNSTGQAKICVVEVDVLITASVEFPQEKKDNILVRKFNGFYQQEAYIIQDERIDHNLFQVIGIKEQKVREVYALIPPQRVESLIPYGMALRQALICNNIDLNKTVVMVDDLGHERLVTVFDGMKFSRTRVIVNNGEDILPEIKRSQIDFFKKTEEFISKKPADFVIIVNNQDLLDEIQKQDVNLKAEYLNIAYPALEGLKNLDSLIKYTLPEENIRKRKEIELKEKITCSVLSVGVLAIGLFFVFSCSWELALLKKKAQVVWQLHGDLKSELSTLDKVTYREELQSHKSLNYGISYLSILEIIPSSYEVNAFNIYKTSRWHIDMTLFDDGPLEDIPRIKILKNAQIADIFVNNQPGKQLKVGL